MALQTAVDRNQRVGFAGQIFYDSSVSDTYAAGPVGVGENNLAWGLVTFRDPTLGADSIALPAAAGRLLADFAGFIGRYQYEENAIGAGYTIVEGDAVNVMRIGEIYAVANTPMQANGPVNVVLTDTADVTNVGKLVAAAGGTQTVLDLSTVVRVISNTSSDNDQLVRVSTILK